MTLPEDVTRQITDARQVLEHPSLAIRLADKVGAPLEYLVKKLPGGAQEIIIGATSKALHAALDVALRTLDRSGGQPSDWLHRAAVAATGAAGGAFGLPALAVELPVSLTLMLRSIAAHARAQGEDLGAVATRLECLTVFAYGSPSPGDDAADSAYFAVRAAFARSVSKAAEYVAEQGVAKALGERSAPALVQLIARIAQRVGVSVTDKAAAQLVPVLGAAGGAVVNTIFMQHYQSVGRAHFTIRRLERVHGADEVRRVYDLAGPKG